MSNSVTPTAPDPHRAVAPAPRSGRAGTRARFEADIGSAESGDRGPAASGIAPGPEPDAPWCACLAI